MPLGGGKLVMFRAAEGELPAYSLDGTGGTKYLSMTGANFGTAFNRKKLAFSAWVYTQLSPPAGTTSIFQAATTVATGALRVQYLTNGKIRGQLSFTGAGSISYDSAVDISDNAWHHIYLKVDTTQATDSERVKLYIDGVSSYGGSSWPNLDDDTVGGGTQDANIGGDGGNDLTALVYQAAFFENNLPGIGDLYNAGNPKSVVGLSGLYSYLDVANGTVESDGVIATDWTNNGSVVSSLNIP